MGTKPSSSPMTLTAVHSRPLARWKVANFHGHPRPGRIQGRIGGGPIGVSRIGGQPVGYAGVDQRPDVPRPAGRWCGPEQPDRTRQPIRRSFQQDGDHAFGLGHLVIVAGHFGKGAVGGHRPGRPGARRPQGGRRRRHHLRSRTVVLIEPGHLHSRHQLGQSVDEARICSVPSVDGLVGISDRTEVDPVTPQCLEQPELGRVHVLELVHGKVPVPPPSPLGEAGVAARRGRRP